MNEAELLTLAAAVENHSAHPLAHAIVRAAQSRGLSILSAAEDVASVTGRRCAGCRKRYLRTDESSCRKYGLVTTRDNFATIA